MQGYGHIDEIAALYGLMWNTPRVMCSMMKRMKKEKNAGNCFFHGKRIVQNTTSETICYSS